MDSLIVTHINPDLDAITSVWLVRKFINGFKEAKVSFVAAGNTYKNEPVDNNPNIIHVDTGLGKFDHHQLNNKTCASELVFKYLKKIQKEIKNEKALIRLIKVVNDIDNFRECNWPQPTADYFNFNLPEILNGLKAAGELDDTGLIEYGSKCLEGIYISFKIKIKAELDLKNGYSFDTKWGKAIGCLTRNDIVLKLGQKMGYVIVVQKDSQTEHIRIKARPDSVANLSKVKQKLEALDPEATWFLHISKKMLLNGSIRNPTMKPSKLSLKKVIEVLKSI